MSDTGDAQGSVIAALSAAGLGGGTGNESPTPSGQGGGTPTQTQAPVAPSTAPQAVPSTAPQTQPGPGGTPQGQSDPSHSPFARDFLQLIPEADREVVGRYVQSWDAGVTRRFQELHNQLKPWEELGADFESVQQAMTVKQMLDEQPEVILAILQKELGGGGIQQEQPPVDDGGDQFQLPPQVQEQLGKIDTLEGLVTRLAQMVMQGNQAKTQEEEDRALQQHLDSLRTEFKPLSDQLGDWDENIVLSYMDRGMSGPDAVKAYYQAIQNHINKVGQGAPNIPPSLGGGGAPPSTDTRSITDLNRKETAGLVASLMQNVQRQA